jgi:hypothetical protein
MALKDRVFVKLDSYILQSLNAKTFKTDLEWIDLQSLKFRMKWTDVNNAVKYYFGATKKTDEKAKMDFSCALKNSKNIIEIGSYDSDYRHFVFNIRYRRNYY